MSRAISLFLTLQLISFLWFYFKEVVSCKSFLWHYSKAIISRKWQSSHYNKEKQKQHKCPIIDVKWSEVKWSRSVMSDSATLWTVANQAPPSMGFSRQEYWSELPFPSPGELPDPGIKPRSPTLHGGALTSEPWERLIRGVFLNKLWYLHIICYYAAIKIRFWTVIQLLEEEM